VHLVEIVPQVVGDCGPRERPCPAQRLQNSQSSTPQPSVLPHGQLPWRSALLCWWFPRPPVVQQLRFQVSDPCFLVPRSPTCVKNLLLDLWSWFPRNHHAVVLQHFLCGFQGSYPLQLPYVVEGWWGCLMGHRSAHADMPHRFPWWWVFGVLLLKSNILLAQHSMDLRAMFAQSVQEYCLLVLHICTPCTPGLFLKLFFIWLQACTAGSVRTASTKTRLSCLHSASNHTGLLTPSPVDLRKLHYWNLLMPTSPAKR